MLVGKRNPTEVQLLPLWSAVFCLDCEVVSNSQGDECSACKSHSLVSLARMLGGSLLVHKAGQFQGAESGLFDAKITVELPDMQAKELSTTVERVTSVLGPRLARDRALFHVSVKPAADRRRSQASFHFAEQDAA